ncbi:MAG: glycerophosphodiester phosphodiesterase [Candidatus Hydrogenedentes bacterium]|nr:glycerophosphodiester phosphodiesterase [Candidatus Hydrogenedentota bacterium]
MSTGVLLAGVMLVLDAALTAAGACAHRGDQKSAPENTLPAFQLAVEKGAHQIEFDVQLSKDGVLVLMHDATVDRTTNGAGKVSDLTFDQLRALDAGSWFRVEFAGTRIPTLREALETITPPTLCNVHLKDTPGVAAATAKLLAEMGRLEQCFLACTVEQAQEARRVAPTIRICNMSRQEGNRDAYVQSTLAQQCAFIQLHKQNGLEGLPEAVARLHAGGVKVNFFGAQDEPTIRALAAAGVDYILTDDLDLCLRILREPPIGGAAEKE